MSFHVPNQYRVRTGRMSSDDSVGNCGAFMIPPRSRILRAGEMPLAVVASDGEGWEHVSVSLPNRCPTWDEMCHIKAIFWDDEDCVVQFHPPRAAHVNNHPYCLHMWRQVGQDYETPPMWMVGYKSLGVIA